MELISIQNLIAGAVRTIDSWPHFRYIATGRRQIGLRMNLYFHNDGCGCSEIPEYLLEIALLPA